MSAQRAAAQTFVATSAPEICEGVLFWSCTDCGFAWPRFAGPISDWVVQASIEAAEEYEPRTRRSDR